MTQKKKKKWLKRATVFEFNPINDIDDGGVLILILILMLILILILVRSFSRKSNTVKSNKV